MDGYLSGRNFGYDQAGHTDPYWNIDQQRYSVNPSAIKNINTPVHHHVFKRPYEQQSTNQQCQELLIDMRHNQNELKKLKSEIEELTTKKKPEKQSESFLGGLAKNDNNLVYILIFVMVVFIILQIQIQQTNDMIRILMLHINEQKNK